MLHCAHRIPSVVSESFDQVRARVQASFDRQGLMRHLGAELVNIEPGTVTVRLAHRPEITQQDGLVHAGATSSIADTAGGYAAMTVMDPGDNPLTVEYKINLMSPARAPVLEAVATVIRSGRTLTVCSVEVFGVDGDERTVVAASQQTLYRATH